MIARPDVRGTGIASRLVAEALDVLRGEACTTVVIGAQTHLATWYARFGFVVSGPEYVEDGIPHVPMRLELADDPRSARRRRPRLARTTSRATGTPTPASSSTRTRPPPIDTLCVPSQTAAFVAEIEALGLRVRRTVLTGSTIEFVGGHAAVHHVGDVRAAADQRAPRPAPDPRRSTATSCQPWPTSSTTR